MTSSAWRVRVATEKDRKLLARFRCATGTAAWEREVELEVRSYLLDWAFAEGAAVDTPTILMVFDIASGDLVALGAHERQFLGTSALDRVSATKIHLVAVAKKWQGNSFPTGERVSDVVMNAVLTDIATHVPPRDPRVFAIVHERNAKSIALCARFGLVKEIMRQNPDYRILVTEHHAATLEHEG
jgi:hypothetical protein